MLKAVDIPNANHFTYKRYTVKELSDAFTKICEKQPKLDPFTIYANKLMMDAIRESISQQWEIMQCVQTPCPNCGETALDGHCRNCDYPYNTI